MLGRWEFELPTQVRFGRGRLGELGTVVREIGRRALLVGYRDQSGLEQLYARAAQSLRDADVTVTELFDVPPDPDAELAATGAETARQAQADLVIGLGGGSVLDAAKGIAVLARSGGTAWDYTTANEAHRSVPEALPIVAVPTTSGTGSEVTPVAVFTHHGVGPDADVPLKASISSPLIRPRVALIDPDVTLGSPPRLTAACGADALGHALEAYISRAANPLSSALAARAVRLIVKNLARAVEDTGDPEPREALSLAAMLAGAAFGSAGVVMTHAIAQALGAVLHVPHGEAVAIGTPINLHYNLDSAEEQYAQLAHYCGVTSESRREQAEGFVELIADLLRSVGLPNHIDSKTIARAAGADVADEAARQTLAEKLARNAFASTHVPLKLNPRRVRPDDLKQVFLELFSTKN
ncbi:MAG: iron-containing alcohol dehydrogenase [Planctomycetes bacterium]|nr:iron-containing alcohol dehydrogenase [Planctomycetota bacterium]